MLVPFMPGWDLCWWFPGWRKWQGIPWEVSWAAMTEVHFEFSVKIRYWKWHSEARLERYMCMCVFGREACVLQKKTDAVLAFIRQSTTYHGWWYDIVFLPFFLFFTREGIFHSLYKGVITNNGTSKQGLLTLHRCVKGRSMCQSVTADSITNMPCQEAADILQISVNPPQPLS